MLKWSVIKGCQRLKAKIYRTVIGRIMIHSLEKWALTRIEDRQMEGTEMGVRNEARKRAEWKHKAKMKNKIC